MNTSTKGRVVRWSIANPDDWAELTVDLGPIQGTAVMSSREAREFAIAVISDQGPYLCYQPPNDSMKENPGWGSVGQRRDGEVGWKKRGRVRDCQEALAELRERYGDEAFGYAVQRVVS